MFEVFSPWAGSDLVELDSAGQLEPETHSLLHILRNRAGMSSRRIPSSVSHSLDIDFHTSGHRSGADGTSALR